MIHYALVLARKVIETWRREGIRAVIIKSQRKIRRRFRRRPRVVPLPPTALLPTDKVDVIVFSVIDWDFRFQRPQQLSRQLAAHGHRVFYLRTAFPREKTATAHVSAIEPGVADVTLTTPTDVNAYRGRIGPELLDAWERAFARLREEQRVAEAVCLVHLPFWRPLVARLRRRYGWRVVYDCLDRHADFTTNSPEMVNEEAALTRDADLVIASSRALLQERARENPRSILIANGCDFDHFSAPWGRPPPELEDLPHPIVGYYGAVSDWFDASLLAEIACRRPDWSFPVVGSTDGADLRPLHGLRNVKLIGEQPYARIASFAQGFDACLIPFRKTPLTEAADPVKVYECLAAGKPVVSVRLGELDQLERAGLVYGGGSADELVAATERALGEDGAARSAARREHARRNTWADRYTTLESALATTYPRVSVVVVTYANAHLSRLCLDSIRRGSLWPDLEVIVVDNASPDRTPDDLAEVAREDPRIKLILNPTNVGYAPACNAGIRAATGEYVVTLNNDTVVPRGWLGGLIRHLERDQTIGLVGPVTNAIGNEAKIDVPYTSRAEMEAFAARRAVEREGRSFDIKMLALFCAAMRRTLIEDIGLLDERFEIGMFEDDDYTVRVRERGLRVVCAEDVFVHHFHRAAMKLIPDAEHARIFAANRRRFEEKWGVTWEPHWVP